MKQSFILSFESGEVSLCTITASHCETIRLWKNENRFYFFFQELITRPMQEVWFREYFERADDYMFVVQHDNEMIGCMGFRLIDKMADVYNVILGNPAYGGKGFMSKALALMCSYIVSSSTGNVGLKVLRANPALNWYLRNGFYETAVHDSFLELRLDTTRFECCEFHKEFCQFP
jgi:RimJ/RimL family protein N-acetyltransferase